MYTTAQLIRLKKSTPFSGSLNDFLIEWFESKKDIFVFTDEDDFNADDIEGTFKAHKKRFKETGKIHIWTGCSENSVFGSSRVNHIFRAWHDYTHIVNGLGYSITEEAIVCDIQKDQLPKDWYFEKDLVDCEIRGQAHYFFINNRFITDQRRFTINWMHNSIAALRDPQI